MKRQIRRSGFLFEYAYWFTPKHDRPKVVNRCPFFWRLVFITLVKMPLWWFVYAPIALTIGFFVGMRPRMFRSDGCSDETAGSMLVDYEHWPSIKGVRLLPIVPILIGVILWCLVWGVRWFYVIVFWGHSLLFWLALLFLAIIVLFVMVALFTESKERVKKQEWYQMASEAWKERKEGICPSYEVVD